MTALELWAGPECTLNRVGSSFRDQLAETGFASRLDDLDRLADLGIRSIRFPILWERTERDDRQCDWAWCDARLERMQRLGLGCIAGLVHHGSGPAHTDLLHAGFAPGLARFAGEVATRYPELDRYTPINEPLTTARFSGLYGVWFPHARSDVSFVRALLSQMAAIRQSMAAIRAHAPAAELVQTEDLGLTRSVEALSYQADFENERRWLTFDLLAGRVTPLHPLWPYLTLHGAAPDQLAEFVETPCPPAVIGVNTYVTSERFLDDRLERYPSAVRGGNGRHRYVDVEAVRVHGAQLDGPAARLREAWERYAIPVALTEVHLGCTREEQMRWLNQAWQAASQLRDDGADVRAVTAWAAFGTMDWDSLATRKAGHYEPGLWDSRSTPPRATGLATVAKALAHGRQPDHPVLLGSGWWQRSLRHIYPVVDPAESLLMGGRPLLIVGPPGAARGALARMCRLRGLPFRWLHCDAAEQPDARLIDAQMLSWRPWAVIDSAPPGLTASAVLARICGLSGVPHVHFSSDRVFDGDKSAPYVESDPPRPVSALGDTQADLERRVLELSAGALVVRSSALSFCACDPDNAVTRALRSLRKGDRCETAQERVASPTYATDLAMATLDLLIDGECGVWHLANRGAADSHGLLSLAAAAAGLSAPTQRPIAAVDGIATGHGVLVSERGSVMPTLDDALQRYSVDSGLRAATPACRPGVTKDAHEPALQ